MVKIKSLEEAKEKYKRNLLLKPPVPCPKCGRKTQSEWRCQWCKTVWTKEEIKLREELKKMII
jgi:tRNA(Ile2) C34 agmatinyltransferase TiaS